MRLARAILVLMGVVAHGAEPDAARQSSYEPPRRLRLNVEWPGETNREAFVVLEFDILANGTAANIRLVDDGFHEKRFVDAAMAGLKRSKWEPRRINGVAVDSPGMRQGFGFSRRNETETFITRDFRSEALKVQELIRKGDFAGGEFHANWMLAEKVKLNYEYALLQAQLAQTYAGLGRIHDALRKVGRATVRSDRPGFLKVLDAPPPNTPSNYLLEKKALVQLLDMRMRLLATQGLALEALNTYYELAGLKQLPPDDPLVVLAEQLTAQIRGGGALRARIEIGPDGGWQQFLSRRRFILERVRSGSINSLYLVCEAASRVFEYVPGEEWSVPESWGLCNARVGADPGTTFDFVELPDAPEVR